MSSPTWRAAAATASSGSTSPRQLDGKGVAELMELGGLRRAVGFNGLANGSTATAGGWRDALRRAREQGFIE